jgi:hypothetical protein
MSAIRPVGARSVCAVTELIVRELRLRKFDSVAPLTSPRRAPQVETGGDSGRRPSHHQSVERLVARHSRRRAQPGEIGL